MPIVDDTPGAQTFRCDRCDYAGPAFPNGMTSDYGMDRAGRTYCKDCCHARDLESVALGEPCTSYISSDGRTVGTWHGRKLMEVVSINLVRKYMWNNVYTVWARDNAGRLWVGRGGGPGMYCNLRLSKTHQKERARLAAV